MKKNWKRVGIFVLSMSMLFGQGTSVFAEENAAKEYSAEQKQQITEQEQITAQNQTTEQNPYASNDGQPAVNAAEEFYQVNFLTDEHATVDVYYGKDYTGKPNAENVTKTEARSNGVIDTTGDGQVNFRVNIEDGYELVSVSADTNYKNLKGSDDIGVEGVYRLTKITGTVNVTIKVQSQKQTTGNREDIVLNEIESNGDTTDWVEIYNKGTLPVDISGWYITDDNTNRLDKKKTTPLPEGTILNPGEYLVFDQYVNFDFGLGAPDEVNLFDAAGVLVEKYSWSVHAQGVYARVPDGTGNFTDTAVSTKGAANQTANIVKPTYPNAVAWPGSDKVITYDEGISMFKSDSSGLDFYKGQLYCINNKNGTFWVMDVEKDGKLNYADGFTAEGKNLAFLADAADPASSDPDAEGITVDNAGNAYAAVERDNHNKNVNYNVILKFDPWADGPVVVASKEWNITNVLPDVPANAGIEAVEWVSNEELEGKLFDRNTGDVYHASSYPDAAEDGIFFVALENNGHVYALALKEDGTSQIIADIDPGIGGAMALDYDAYEGILWVGADDGYGNISAKISFNGTASPEITLVNPPAGMDVTRNNEGFAIAEPEYTVNGLRPVYHFMDGVNSGVLTISYMHCDYQEPEHKHTDNNQDGFCDECGAAMPEIKEPSEDDKLPGNENPDKKNPSETTEPSGTAEPPALTTNNGQTNTSQTETSNNSDNTNGEINTTATETLRSPKTGENNDMIVGLILFFISGLGLVIAYCPKKKDEI